jgi:predicted restriction endonuclease
VIYKNSCAITGTNEESVLEACHIKAHAETGDNSLENGLLLRSDIHILFDDRLITIDDDCTTIRLSPLVTCPDYMTLNNNKTVRRNRIEDRHREIIAARNSQIDWLRNNRPN